jgi:hypothetical protein
MAGLVMKSMAMAMQLMVEASSVSVKIWGELPMDLDGSGVACPCTNTSIRT